MFPKREVPPGDVVLETARASACSAAGMHDVSLDGARRRDPGARGPGGLGADASWRRRSSDSTPADSGEILLRGQPVRSIRRATRSRLGSATCRRIGGSTAWCSRCRSRRTPAWRSLQAVSRRGLIDFARERELARGYVERLRIKTRVDLRRGGDALGRQPAEGGAGRWLAIQPQRAHSRRADAGHGRRRRSRRSTG